jgi:ABC-type microcin C transport system duplicated ATPase subunit YejF
MRFSKVRLALALIVYPAPDLLVLDEVSTHLDMVCLLEPPSISSLIRFLFLRIQQPALYALYDHFKAPFYL